jgi:hypothetical protein
MEMSRQNWAQLHSTKKQKKTRVKQKTSRQRKGLEVLNKLQIIKTRQMERVINEAETG